MLHNYKGSFLWFIVALFIIIGVVCFGLWFAFDKAFGADINETCLTHAQAKAKWPTSYLYWRTAKHCWYAGTNQIHSRAATWGKQNSLKLPKPNLDANANIVRHSGRPIMLDPPTGPNIFYPALMIGGGTVDQMLIPEVMNTWPLIVDFDVEPPQFIPWQKRIAAIFDAKP